MMDQLDGLLWEVLNIGYNRFTNWHYDAENYSTKVGYEMSQRRRDRMSMDKLGRLLAHATACGDTEVAINIEIEIEKRKAGSMNNNGTHIRDITDEHLEIVGRICMHDEPADKVPEFRRGTNAASVKIGHRRLLLYYDTNDMRVADHGLMLDFFDENVYLAILVDRKLVELGYDRTTNEGLPPTRDPNPW